jgi:hypothetical protein
METTTELSPRARLAMGLVFVLAGLPIMALATGLITPRLGSMHAPPWVVFLAGVSFSLVGLLILLPDTMGKFRGFLGAVFMVGFASIFVWIAFGPGERRFSGGFSIGPLFTSSASSEMEGRIVFGIAAVLLSAFALWGTYAWLRSLFRRGPDDADHPS